MGVENIVILMCHGGFYTGVICQVQQKGLSKGTVGLCIPRIGRAITI